MHILLSLSSFSSLALAGQVLWDGRFNDFTASSDLNKCELHHLSLTTVLTRHTGSWGNQVGPYQYYIHGKGEVNKYVNLSPSFKNPADTTSKQGAKITIDNTAKWNSDMWRTELIPQTKAAINKGKVVYHFSMKRSAKNAPSVKHEHQVCFLCVVHNIMYAVADLIAVRAISPK